MSTTKAKKRTVRVALLCCGEFTGKLLRENGDFFAFYKRWLKKSLPKGAKVKPKVEPYKVYQEDRPLPEDDEIGGYDAILVSGSPSDAWADKPTWIPRLVDFLRKVDTQFPQVRIVGFCFGHQVMSRALGGTVDGSHQTPWEIGLTSVHLTYMGKLLYGKEKLELQQFHQDHVLIDNSPYGEALKTGEIYLLGSSTNYPNQGIVKYYPPDPNAPPNARLNLCERIQILTTQGHPEFTEKIVSGLARWCEEKNVIPQKTIDEYFGDKRRESEEKPIFTGGTGQRWATDYDGVRVVGRVFWKMFGVKYLDEDENSDA